MVATAEDTRLCEHCLTAKPLTEFRRRTPNGSVRLNQCRECHNQAERKRRARKRQRQSDRKMATALSQLKNEPNDKKLELIAGAMFRQFGGLQGFLAAWTTYTDRALAQGGSAACRCFEAVFRLVQYCETKSPDLSDVSDEDLERSLMQSTENLILQHPELAVRAAHQLGWTVIPHTAISSSIFSESQADRPVTGAQAHPTS